MVMSRVYMEGQVSSERQDPDNGDHVNVEGLK